MGREEADVVSGSCLVVGNYCHDVLFRDGVVIGESLGGAASFISNVLDALSPSPNSLVQYVSKVGADFAYTVPHTPLIAASCPTTLFHAHFQSQGQQQDRGLRRVRSCDPILPSDLPDAQFDFGVAAGVAGEIPPETLTRMLDLCRVVLVDVQGLIRIFDPADGTVGHIPMRSTGFFHLLPRIAFLKASAEEAAFLDLEDCGGCGVIITDGKDGCRVYWKDKDKAQVVPPFSAVQIDPTGAGDSFLGGFLLGLLRGLPVPDAALLGNLFGSLTVAQIGVPKLDLGMMKNVKQELERHTTHCLGLSGGNVAMNFRKSDMHEEFQASLLKAAKLASIDSLTELGDADDKH